MDAKLIFFPIKMKKINLRMKKFQFYGFFHLVFFKVVSLAFPFSYTLDKTRILALYAVSIIALLTGKIDIPTDHWQILASSQFMIRIIPQETVDNNLGPKALDPNYCRQPTL